MGSKKKPHNWPAELCFGISVLSAVAYMILLPPQPPGGWSNSVGHGFFLVVGAAYVGSLVYLLPSIVAFKRIMEARWAIFGVNLVLGWTLIVWLVCLVWSYSGPNQQMTKID